MRDSDALTINMMGLPGDADIFGRKYDTYAIRGSFDDMSKLIDGLCLAYASITPDGGSVGSRRVVVIWRRPIEQIEDMVTCRLTIYTEDEYYRICT